MKNKINIITLISVIIAIIPLLIYFRFYSIMPSKVPIHYNFNGIEDRFVQKSSVEVITMSSFGIISILFMKLIGLVVIKFSDNINKERVKVVMDIIVLLTTLLATAVSSYFLVLTTGIFKLNLLYIFQMINIMLGILAIIIGNYMPKFRQNKFSGFRTKAALSDKNIWFKTQQFSGKVWIFSGIILIIFSIILGSISLTISLTIGPIVYIFMAIIPVTYSQNISKIS
ncbi:MAG: SdpI family protein [Bacillota bacterium]|nr:SdpI family protein [Bacillota bacterium]